MSGSRRIEPRGFAPNQSVPRWIVPKADSRPHDPNCPNPNCPYGAEPSRDVLEPYVPLQPNNNTLPGENPDASNHGNGNAPLAPLDDMGSPEVPAGPAVDFAILAGLIEQNAAAIALLTRRENTPGEKGDRGEQGIPGDPGATGSDGGTGEAGKDATIDEAAIEAMSEEAIAALAARLPPIIFQAAKPDGTLYGDPMPKKLGDTLIQNTILFHAKTNQPVGKAE